MDALGSERAAVFGACEGGSMSMLFAATYSRASAGAESTPSSTPDDPLRTRSDGLNTRRPSFRIALNERSAPQALRAVRCRLGPSVLSLGACPCSLNSPQPMSPLRMRKTIEGHNQIQTAIFAIRRHFHPRV
jgi:hypothetical protein